ncbi:MULTISPECIES: ANTAR domain-containing response regulator [Clostridiaceae]|uniref:ANTAR domain-containing protein n=1 Tax=Clostridium facile TaxID=2763035 RepID=A0ABR7IRJ0_9CLOT|nr:MULTISPECIES: ANTAR domain-containing protein [Clostridiaceae]MBC5787634.1 ANTAR domain-containing protein [Clostridium facile]
MVQNKDLNSVLVVSSSKKFYQQFMELLPKSEFSPLCSVTTVGEAKRILVDRSFRIVIVNTPLSDDFGIHFAIELAEKQNCGILIFVKSEIQDAICQQVENYGILTLPKPVSKQMVFQSIKLLVAMQQKIRALETKASSLQSKMEDIRLVNRAKLLLIEQLKMSESEAHRYIEKRAMDTCVKRRKVAEDIIKTYEN